MKTEFYPSNERGYANHGWLEARHTFSFASWYNPNRMHFGVLRVLNDDRIAGGMGFGTHPHDNMEIITIPLSGALTHQDSMGNKETISTGEIQVMSAGTGIQHSEFNANEKEELRLFQIWLFPNKRNVTPRYDQQRIPTLDRANELIQVLSPNADDEGVWIHQDAWFFMGRYTEKQTVEYKVKKAGNGVFLKVIEGEATVNGQPLNKRDALGVTDTDVFTIEVNPGTELLVMDVPMAVN